DANEFNWTFQVFRLDTVRFFDREYSYFDKYANPRLTLLRTSPDSIIPIPLTVETVMDTLFQDSGSEVLDSLKQIQLEGILRNLKSNQRH
ncbi:MAG: hypothetical protein H6601_06095, partial [Flavobacteriales bacterium]|nr:hypothetical protein [Flavobacteriales bacterium]